MKSLSNVSHCIMKCEFLVCYVLPGIIHELKINLHQGVASLYSSGTLLAKGARKFVIWRPGKPSLVETWCLTKAFFLLQRISLLRLRWLARIILQGHLEF